MATPQDDETNAPGQPDRKTDEVPLVFFALPLEPVDGGVYFGELRDGISRYVERALELGLLIDDDGVTGQVPYGPDTDTSDIALLGAIADGDPRAAVLRASRLPVFVQFLTIGDGDVDFLSELDRDSEKKPHTE